MKNLQLIRKEREKIFKLFLENNKLKFSEIEKSIGLRSNIVAYHIDSMVKEGLLKKEGFYYLLTEDAERYLPLTSSLSSDKLTPLPVILVAVTNKNKILLIHRNKRPYRNLLSMIGGKILFHETYLHAAKRIVKERTGLNVKIKSLNAIMHEMVYEKSVKHSFLLIFVETTTSDNKFKNTEYGNLEWFTIKDVDKLKDKTIPSDYWLIKNKLTNKTKKPSSLEIINAEMKDNNGQLEGFKIV